MKSSTTIANLYDQIQQNLQGAPTETSAFELLIDLESAVLGYAKDTVKYKQQLTQLLGARPHQDSTDTQNIRNTLEQSIIKEHTGITTTISTLLDTYITQIKWVTASLLPLDKKLRQLGIEVIQVPYIYLPPDPDLAPTTGSGTGRENPEGSDYDRVSEIVSLLATMEIGPSDYLLSEGVIAKGRRLPHHLFLIPKLNKSILISNEYGQATYIYDGLLQINESTSSPLKGELRRSGAPYVKCNVDDIGDRRSKIHYYLGQSGPTPSTPQKESDSTSPKSATRSRIQLKDTAQLQNKLITLFQQKEFRNQWLGLDENMKRSSSKYSIFTTPRGKISYTELFRLFGFTENIKELLKQPIYDQMTKLLLGTSYTDIIKGLFQQKEFRNQWLELNDTKKRSSSKYSTFRTPQGEIGYTELFRLFGFTESISELLKQPIYDQMTKLLLGTSYTDIIKGLFQQKEFRNQWLGLDEFVKRNNSKYSTFRTPRGEISYTELFRLFGFTEHVGELLKQPIYDQMTKLLLGDDILDMLDRLKNIKNIQKKKEIIALFQQKEFRNQWLKSNSPEKRSSSKYSTFRAPRGEISYGELCRMFGFTEDAYELYKQPIYDQMTKLLLGDDMLGALDRLQNIKNIQKKKEIIALFQQKEFRNQWLGLDDTTKRRNSKYNVFTTPRGKIGYTEIFRVFGFTVHQSELYKQPIYDQMTKLLGIHDTPTPE